MGVRIFGFGHRSRVGKDTAGNFLAGHLRQTTRNKLVVKIGFASKLKWMCYELYSWAGLEVPEFYEKPENEHLRNTKLPAIGKTPVEIWVEFGTNVGRAIYVDTWTKYPLNLKFDFLILTDVRFPNEINEIWRAGGKVIKIENPTVPIRQGTSVDDVLADFTGWDQVLVNDGNLKSLNQKVIDLYKGYQ